MMMVFCSFPDEETAARIGREIVSEGLAACVNLLTGVRSIYRWQGDLCDEKEVLCIFKVAASKFAELETALLEKHPYETPEIVGVDADRVAEGYLKWVVG